MKIVDRKTFLMMPNGTVFSKFPLKQEGDAKKMMFGISSLSVKGETIFNNDDEPIDFYLTTLGEGLSPRDDESVEEIHSAFCRLLDGDEISFEHCGGRDGFFDDENVGFAILSKEEVLDTIQILINALKAGYDSNSINFDKLD